MAGFGFPGVEDSPLPAPLMSRQERVRQALFGTLPGRAMVVGFAVKLLVGGRENRRFRPPFLNVVDTVAARDAAGARTLSSAALLAKRRLLWRPLQADPGIFIGFSRQTSPGVLPAGRAAAVLQRQLDSCRAGCRRSRIGEPVAQSTAVGPAARADGIRAAYRATSESARDFRRVDCHRARQPALRSKRRRVFRRRRGGAGILAGDGRVLEARRASPYAPVLDRLQRLQRSVRVLPSDD
jgi:hypothetical protein